MRKFYIQMLTAVGAALLWLPVINVVRAEGMLDLADPCKSVGKNFNATATALSDHADAVIAGWDAKKDPPAAIRGLYLGVVRKAALQAWFRHESAKSLLVTRKQADPNFDETAFFYA